MAHQTILEQQGVTDNSNELSTLSSDIAELCKVMHSQITQLKEEGAFRTVDASEAFFLTINEIYDEVPTYTGNILTFSEFLSGYVLTNYDKTDTDAQAEIKNDLQENVNQLDNAGELGNGVNLDKISASAQGALKGDWVKVKRDAFEDGELEFKMRDDGTIQIMKNGTTLGFTTQDGATNGNVTTQTEISTAPTVSAEQPTSTNPVTEASTAPVNNTVSTETPTTETPTIVTTSATSTPAPGDYKVYRYETSNKIATVAREMGFSEEQVDIAVGISRLETGNYTSKKSQQHNYGGMRSGSGWASFDTEDEGIKAYLNNLKKNYYDQGLNTPETIQPKYAPSFENDGDAWVKNVYGCMK